MCNLSSLGRRDVFSAHVWHVQLSRAKELCILLNRGNKEKVKQKTFPLLRATVTWQPPRNSKYHSAAAYIRDLCERQSSHRNALSLTRIKCETFRNTLQRGERRTLLPGFKLQEMLAFVSDVFSVCVYKNDDVRFSLSPRPLLWLQTICIGSVVQEGIMGQLYENSTLERRAGERRVESKWRW